MAEKIRWGAKSITNNRENNEDRYLIDPAGRYFLVADGMGGQAAGEKASELAVELVPQKLEQLLTFDQDSPDQVKSAINKTISYANSEIMSLSALDVKYHNMGTTIVLVVVVGETLYVAGVGDSRVYRLDSSGALTQLTTDHSLTQALVDAGTISLEDAKTHRFKNVLHRYLGSKEGDGPTDVKLLPLESGDRYLICSDGVNEGAEDETLAAILQKNDDPQIAADEIVAASQAGGANDNITCVVLHLD